MSFHISRDSYKPTEERLSTIKNFSMPVQPTPANGLTLWCGISARPSAIFSHCPCPGVLRELLKKPSGKLVYLGNQLQQRLKQFKEVICQLAKDGLACYDKTRPLAAITDWSKDGIGFVVLQQYCTCTSSNTSFCCQGGWRLALCGSRHLTAAESGYSAADSKALVVAWCLRKARLFLLWC